MWLSCRKISMEISEPHPERSRSPVLIEEALQGATAEMDASQIVIWRPVTALLS